MSFAVRLSTDLVSVEAGANVSLSIEVINRSEAPDRFELEIEGLDPEWVAVPVPSFSIDAQDTSSEKAFFRPPRTSESLAGNYPFVVKVRSLSSGELRSVQGVLQIRPYHHVSMEITPKKGSISPFRRENDFSATLINLGNTEQSLQLAGTDPEEACAYEFEQDQVTISPGQQRQVAFTVTPTTSSFLASSRLYGFQVTARGIDFPSVSAFSQAQLEQRAFLSPSTLVFLVFASLLAGAWLYMMPKPPSIELWADKERVTLGETLQVSWRAASATRVTVEAQGMLLYDGPQTSGSIDLRPSKGGQVVITGVAKRGEKISETQQDAVIVEVPQPAPDPEIALFKTNQTKIKAGQSVILSYKFNEAVTKATLSPQNIELNTKSNEIEVRIEEPGKRTFTIIAENKDGKAVRRSVEVDVEDASRANIIVWRAEPASLTTGGLVTLSWQLTNAVRAEISDGANTVEVDPSKGTKDVLVDRTTTYTLTGYDSNGKKVVSTSRVVVRQPPPPPPSQSYSPSGPFVPHLGGLW